MRTVFDKNTLPSGQKCDIYKVPEGGKFESGILKMSNSPGSASPSLLLGLVEADFQLQPQDSSYSFLSMKIVEQRLQPPKPDIQLKNG